MATGAANDLYRASTIVTGQENLEERRRGTRQALLAVLAKVSADPSIAEEAAGAVLDLESYVVSHRYTDRKAGVQISDEQGTRERSYVLEVAFDPARIDALLASLGRAPWHAARPIVRVQLRVTDRIATYLVTETSERGWGQREAIRSAGGRAGLPVVLPPATAGAIVLSGTMAMTAQGYWSTAWRLEGAGAPRAWTVPATTFDRAIEDGIWNTARHLARAR